MGGASRWQCDFVHLSLRPSTWQEMADCTRSKTWKYMFWVMKEICTAIDHIVRGYFKQDINQEPSFTKPRPTNWGGWRHFPRNFFLDLMCIAAFPLTVSCWKLTMSEFLTSCWFSLLQMALLTVPIDKPVWAMISDRNISSDYATYNGGRGKAGDAGCDGEWRRWQNDGGNLMQTRVPRQVTTP